MKIQILLDAEDLNDPELGQLSPAELIDYLKKAKKVTEIEAANEAMKAEMARWIEHLRTIIEADENTMNKFRALRELARYSESAKAK